MRQSRIHRKTDTPHSNAMSPNGLSVPTVMMKL
jgi:hypothetical protein